MIGIVPVGKPLRDAIFFDVSEAAAVRLFSRYFNVNSDLVVLDSVNSRRSNRVDEYTVKKIIKKSKVSSIVAASESTND